MKRIFHAAACAAFLLPCIASAQSAGSNVVSLGWLHAFPQDSSSSLTTYVAPTPMNGALGLPPSFNSPGTGLSVGQADTLGITFSHFLTDQFAVTALAGVPPKFQVYGSGTITPPGPAGTLGTQNIGLGAVNPIVKSARLWSPAVILQYYIGQPTSRFRPFLGVGVSYNWFSDVQLGDNFIAQTRNTLGQVLAAGAGKPGPTQVSGDASSSWQPVFNAGFLFNITEHWGLLASLSYIPLKTTSSVTIKAADGTTLAVSKSDLKADPLITFLAVSYKF